MQHPTARRTDVLVQDVGSDTLVYDRLRDTAHSLGPVAAFVYKHADGATSVAELTARLGADRGAPADEELTAAALAELARVNLLDAVGTATGDAISRRSAVRRLGAAVAVPLVTSLVVPAAAAAQSTFVVPGGTPAAPPAGSAPPGGGSGRGGKKR